MNIKEAYNQWSAQYDTNENKTRDLEGVAMRSVLKDIESNNCLEIGCGTGKNTRWLAQRAKTLVAVDFSEQMLEKAKLKNEHQNVQFVQADIQQPWHFVTQKVNFVTFSLVLEHIENLEAIFEKLALCTVDGAYIYIGELHPFKQYNGSKARFETENGVHVLTCFTHHISEFTNIALRFGFKIVTIQEFFDDNDASTIPRIMCLLLQKN